MLTPSALPNLTSGLLSPTQPAYVTGILTAGITSTPAGTPASVPQSGTVNPKGTSVPVLNSDGTPSLFALPSPNTTPGAMSTIANSQPVVLGAGYTLQFDPQTMNGIITPALATASESMIGSLNNGGMMSYSGSDCRVLMEVATPVGGNGTPRLSKQLIELTTLTVSIHRSKAQVSAVSAASFIKTWGNLPSPLFAIFYFSSRHQPIFLSISRMPTMFYGRFNMA